MRIVTSTEQKHGSNFKLQSQSMNVKMAIITGTVNHSKNGTVNFDYVNN